MKFYVIILLLSLFVLIGPSSAQVFDKNYCLDPEVWAQWDEMAKKYPDDDPLQILHALRIGLCVKIELGSITFEEAVDLMNDYSDIVINERGKEKD